ncbi:octanoyl-[acyl-carrier-protein]:protein N-octanoyltransferase LIPT2, mitochondrial-like [Glandiceps talaboti]
MLTNKTTVFLRNLGRIRYEEAWKIQRQEVRKHLDYLLLGKQKNDVKKPNNMLLVCEHDPVYTVGIRDKVYQPKDEKYLKDLGAEFYRTDRGGLITFHGPGQLVAYPILNLTDFNKKSIRWYVCQLEQCVIQTCQYYGIDAHTMPDTGVWVKDNKIAAIGIHCSRYITSHGLAVNCNTDLGWFQHIVPCGIVGKGVTSLSKELNRQVTIQDLLPNFINAFERVFTCRVLKDVE